MSAYAKSFKAKDNPNVRERTHQSFAKDANINTLMAKYKKTGYLVDLAKPNPNRVPRFDDYSDIGDFQNVVNRIKEAEADFIRLPASTRARFNHSVGALIEFIMNPENLVASIDLGLLPESLRPKSPIVDKVRDEGAAAAAAA